MSKKFLFLTSFVLLLSLAYNSYGDTLPPRPTRASWLDEPAATGPYTIRMRVADACDANDMPCTYNFTCTNDGSKSSGWQSSPVYEASGLTPKATYTFNVQARDSAVPPNTDTASYSASATTDDTSTPPVLRLDLNNSANNDDANTQPSFLPFIIENSGTEINGVVIDLGGDISSARRSDPTGAYNHYQTGGLGGDPNNDPCYYSPRAGERIYRDFICGNYPSGVGITLWGLGVNQNCNITIWTYDSSVGDANRVAYWYGNGTHIFDTNFIGGSTTWPRYINQTSTSYLDFYKYAFSGRATADYLGRIILTNTAGPNSPGGMPFAFVDAIKVEPNMAGYTYVPTQYSQHPVPVNGAGNIPADVILGWKASVGAGTHDVYLGTNFNNVNNASRGSPLNVLVSQDQSATTYDPPEFLDLNTTYYWRVDENDATPTIWKGEVWNFTILPYLVLDNFNSYANDTALRSIWKDGSTNGTSAEVDVNTAIVRDGNSMKYLYKNTLSPYYSEVSADVNTARPNGLGCDPNWLGMGAKTLSLWFYGLSGNNITKPMYVKLTDGDSPPRTAQVNYDGDMNDTSDESWREWSISLQDFVDYNNVNLSNVKTITLGFGDGTQAASDGTMYFDNIRLYKHRRICRTGWLATGDLNGDCKVDCRDLKILTDNWLADCTEPENCGGADFEPTDGVVNLIDLSDFAMQWLLYDHPPVCDEGFTVPPMPTYSSLPTNPYLPDPFRFMNGSRMTIKAQWPCRRAEIAALTQEFELGYMQYTPYSATTGSFSSNTLTVTVNDNGHQISFNCSISYPTTGSPPYPAIIGCGSSSLNNTVLRSLGVAIITYPSDTIAQENSGSSRGIGLFYDMYGSGHSAGALMAFAWGMDRLIDAIEKTPACNIDPNRLGVTGCSRWGKGALICGAFDERIKLTIPEESGSGGCASWRVSDWQGTTVQTLCELVGENVWMRANFNQFCNNTNKLPFDHHEIAGLCAPRALLFIENSAMVWLGNVSTWTTGNVAHKIWEALGIPDTMGYSSVGHGDHCGFPSSQQPEVTAYVQKFLVGGGTADTNVMKCDGGVIYNEAQWVNWTVPVLH